MIKYLSVCCMYSRRRDTLLLASLGVSLLLLTRTLTVPRSARRQSSANPVTWTSLTLWPLWGGAGGQTGSLCFWGAGSTESKHTRFWSSMAVLGAAMVIRWWWCEGKCSLIGVQDYNYGESFVLSGSVVTLFGRQVGGDIPVIFDQAETFWTFCKAWVK